MQLTREYSFNIQPNSKVKTIPVQEVLQRITPQSSLFNTIMTSAVQKVSKQERSTYRL